MNSGEKLAEEMVWTHAALRRDLTKIRQIADEVAAEGSPDEVAGSIAHLQANSAVWELRASCLSYCRFVSHHHHLEDTGVFPAVRDANPALHEIVARLESDHQAIARFTERIDEVTMAADRDGIVTTLTEFADLLEAHLEFEESHLLPVFRNWVDQSQGQLH